MTPRLLLACLLAVIILPVWVVLNVAADLLTREWDGWDCPTWAKEA